jgi:hypothetical protein
VSVLEIRSYTIKQGHETQFAQLMRTQSLPLLRQAGTDVVAFIACLDSPLAFVLMRAYRDLADRDDSQARFYGGDAWRLGPRQGVLDCIDNYTNVVLEADDRLLASLRQG